MVRGLAAGASPEVLGPPPGPVGSDGAPQGQTLGPRKAPSWTFLLGQSQLAVAASLKEQGMGVPCQVAARIRPSPRVAATSQPSSAAQLLMSQPPNRPRTTPFDSVAGPRSCEILVGLKSSACAATLPVSHLGVDVASGGAAGFCWPGHPLSHTICSREPLGFLCCLSPDLHPLPVASYFPSTWISPACWLASLSTRWMSDTVTSLPA